jgi:transposase
MDMLLQAIHRIQSERRVMEQLDYNLLFRWFVRLHPDGHVWDTTAFNKNDDRLLNEGVMIKYVGLMLTSPKVKQLLGSELLSVEST